MQKEKGVILYLAIVITTLMLAMVLGLGSIFIGQLKILRGVGHSVIALYAAEAGMEKILWDDKDVPGSIVADCLVHTSHAHTDCHGTLSNGATYDVTVESGGSCSAPTYCIKSSGVFRNSERKIFVDR